MTNSVDHEVGPMNGGASIGDFNNDGISDFFLPSTGVFPDRIFMGKPDDTFQKVVPIIHNATRLHRGVGSTVGDFDGDGWQDIFVTSFGDIGDLPGPGANRLYHNNQDGSFTEVAASTGFADFGQGRGLVSFDYQNDGDLDLLVVNNNGPVHLYRNNMRGNKHWLRIDVNTSANSALAPGGSGTRITVQVNDKEMVQVMDGGASYLGCSQITTLFGLGSARSVNRVTVEWADGFRTVIKDIDDNQILEIAAPTPLIQDADLHRGQNFDTTVRGLVPGETAWFVSSMSGTTMHGPGHSSFGDVTLNLRAPVSLIGSAVADARGEATLTSLLPAGFPLTQIATQVVVSRDPDGQGSIKSNVVVRQVQN